MPALQTGGIVGKLGPFLLEPGEVVLPSPEVASIARGREVAVDRFTQQSQQRDPDRTPSGEARVETEIDVTRPITVTLQLSSRHQLVFEDYIQDTIHRTIGLIQRDRLSQFAKRR